MKTALLIIDIQNDYFPGGKMELSGSVEASLKAKDLLNYFRTNNLPVIHIQHFSVQPGAVFFVPETQGVNIQENVLPIAGEKIIVKNFPNSFRNTELQQHLTDLGINKLVICGMMTHMCIDTTTRAAFDLGYQCILVKDACATRDLIFDGKTISADNVHGAFIAAIGAVFAKVLSLDECLSILNSKE